MSNSYSPKSLGKLQTCDQKIISVMYEVLKIVDHSIIEGSRDEFRQGELFHQGLSKVKWPDSSHNFNPSRAVDAMAYPIDWKNRERNAMFAGVVLGVASHMGVELIWGGDWNRNFDPTDNWMDAAHFELVKPALPKLT